MILASLREQEGKEQRHGAINAGETACRERGCSAVPPCPEEGERDHAAGILCYHGVQSSVCSLPAPHVCQEGHPGTGDPGPHEALPLAQTPKACVRSCRDGGSCLDVPPEWRPLWQATPGSHAGAPASHGKTWDRGPGSSCCLPSEDGVCHHGPSAPGREEQGREPEACSPDKTRKPVEAHSHRLFPGTLGCNSGTGGGGLGES
jgi:hypothetical protein